MALSCDEKALVDAAHMRIQFLRKYRSGWITGAFGGFIGSLPAFISIIKLIEDPHSSHRAVAILSGLMGLSFGLGILSLFVALRQRKRDEELIRLIERHFPDECSWKQEERLLAEAEDIRLKAKMDSLIHQAAR